MKKREKGRDFVFIRGCAWWGRWQEGDRNTNSHYSLSSPLPSLPELLGCHRGAKGPASLSCFVLLPPALAPQPGPPPCWAGLGKEARLWERKRRERGAILGGWRLRNGARDGCGLSASPGQGTRGGGWRGLSGRWGALPSLPRVQLGEEEGAPETGLPGEAAGGWPGPAPQRTGPGVTRWAVGSRSVGRRGRRPGRRGLWPARGSRPLRCAGAEAPSVSSSAGLSGSHLPNPGETGPNGRGQAWGLRRPARPHVRAVFSRAFGSSAVSLWVAFIHPLGQPVLQPEAAGFLPLPALIHFHHFSHRP